MPNATLTISKRFFDLALGIPLFLISLPFVFVGAVLVFIADGRPVFYFQEREGLGGKPFRVWKLRTMKRESEALLEVHLANNPSARAEWENRFKLEKDPRVIGAIGEYLRRSNIDELPQLWNVIKGEMSLVGPRPFPRYHLEKFTPEWRALRASVKPGVTGLWQVTSGSEDTLREQERLDREYLARQSFLFDVKLIFLTAVKLLRKRR